MIHSTKVLQMVPLHWLKGCQSSRCEMSLNEIFYWTTKSKLKVFYDLLKETNLANVAVLFKESFCVDSGKIDFTI